MLASLAAAALIPAMRPPSVPLMVHTPFFSTWSPNDKLTDNWARHWSGRTTAMLGLARIDGKVVRFMGPAVVESQAMEQTNLQVTATRSIYTFQDSGVELKVEFLSPLLTDNLETLNRPVSYVTFETRAVDGKTHKAELYVDFTGEWVTKNDGQQIIASRHKIAGGDVLSLRAANQDVLGSSGDQTMAGWGTLFTMAPGSETAIGGHYTMRNGFMKGDWREEDDLRFPRAVSDDFAVLAHRLRFPEVGSKASSQYLMAAYDEGYGIEWLKRKLRPYWNRKEIGATAMLKDAMHEYSSVRSASEKFDEKLVKELEAAGGADYAKIGTLAYRQCLAGHGIVEDIDGSLMMFSKENTSNGCIATVDVTFPASPFFLYFNPELLKAQLRPVLEYSSMARWKFPFAPHDLGTYPLANGQVYGGGERDETNQMPVEESANMLIMIGALCRQDKNADFAKPYMRVLDKWAKYLEKEGFDPANQLCTDDFSGHLAHNTNLSIKAIVALRSYAEILTLSGEKAEAKRLNDLAKKWAGDWVKKADDGDHFRLAFDRPGTWSQKYNLVWDKLMGYGLFDPAAVNKEMASYTKRENAYGLPLDNRAAFTKADWLVWTATIGTDEQFKSMMKPLSTWIDKTESRVGFSDWYDTKNSRTMGMHTRTVIGGVFIKLLEKSGRLN